MRFRIPIVIPAVLVALSLSFSLLMFLNSLNLESEQIRENVTNSLIRDISKLQNILYNRLTEDNYSEARLNISVTAMDPLIQTIFLVDEKHIILLANRYLMEGNNAEEIEQYHSVIAQQVMKTNEPTVFFRDEKEEQLTGYFPVILKLESKKGLPVKRVGALFVESSIAPLIANSKNSAIERSIVFASLMFLVAAILSLILHNWLSRRLMKLTNASRTFSAGNLMVKAQIGGKDELAELGNSFDEMVDRIKCDIMYREKAENELRLLNESLEQRIDERTALLREAQHVAKMGYLNWNITDNTFEWSDEIYNLFGYEADEIERDIENLRSHIDPQYFSAENQMVDAVLQGEDSKCDLKIKTKNGSTRWIHYRMVPVKNEHGEIVAARGIMQDITDLKIEMENREKLEKQLLQSQKMDSLGQLTGGIAHDFNNILASIMGFTSLLKRLQREDANEKILEYLDQITEASNRGKNLVQQMLAFGRTKDAVHDKEIVKLKGLLENTLALLKPIFPSSIKLNLDVEDNSIVIAADTNMLGQVITNLCLNARDSLPNSQGQINIYVKRRQITDGVCSSCHHSFSNSYTEICVEDNGVGIDKNILSHLFEPFYSTKPVNKGSGMGLPIVHGIVHKHGGHIIVESQPEHGSRFRCLFPSIEVVKSAADKAMIENSQENNSGQGQHILVVDDEVPLTIFLKELLSSTGYRVTPMTDSQQALEYFKGFHSNIDIVITDQTMPGLTGIQLSEKMLEIDDSIPVIICTGFSEQITDDLLNQKNIHEIMMKPVDDELLLEKVKQLSALITKLQPGTQN